MKNESSQTELSLGSDVTPKVEGLWGKTVAFLHRDIQSFLPGRANEKASPNERSSDSGNQGATPVLDIPVESLVDTSKLSEMAFRREVLDWRDNFHANVTLTLLRVHATFVQQVHADLANTSLFRKLISRSSHEVLQESFVRIVREPLITALRKEESKLNGCAQKWGLGEKSGLAFDVRKLNAECASLHGLGFKPSNKQLILSRCQEVILGSKGLAAVFRDQGLQLSRKLIEAKES